MHADPDLRQYYLYTYHIYLTAVMEIIVPGIVQENERGRKRRGRREDEGESGLEGTGKREMDAHTNSITHKVGTSRCYCCMYLV